MMIMVVIHIGVIDAILCTYTYTILNLSYNHIISSVQLSGPLIAAKARARRPASECAFERRLRKPPELQVSP